MNIHEVKNWMRANVEDYRDERTGEINMTTLAEGAADALDLDAELDKSEGPIWDAAFKVAESAEKEGPTRRWSRQAISLHG